MTQVSERSPQATDRIPITRSGRNLNMYISTFMAYVNAHITLDGTSAGETIAAINEALDDLQSQINTLTQTDLEQLLQELQSAKDFLDAFGDEEDLSSVLATLRSSIEAEAAETYATKTELSDLADDIGQNAAAIEQNATDIAQNAEAIAQNTADIAQNTEAIAQIGAVGSGNVRLTRTEYNALKSAGAVETNVWYIVTDNVDTTIIRELRLGLILIAKNEDQGNTGFTYVFPFTFIS